MGASKLPASPGIKSSDYLRHMESMSHLPFGAGRISHLHVVILGESLASEENNLVFPSPEFSQKALLSSPDQRSIEEPDRFWSEIASKFYWERKWDPSVYRENLDVRNGAVNIEWFKGGTTNICHNAVVGTSKRGTTETQLLPRLDMFRGDEEQLTPIRYHPGHFPENSVHAKL